MWPDSISSRLAEQTRALAISTHAPDLGQLCGLVNINPTAQRYSAEKLWQPSLTSVFTRRPSPMSEGLRTHTATGDVSEVEVFMRKESAQWRNDPSLEGRVNVLA